MDDAKGLRSQWAQHKKSNFSLLQNSLPEIRQCLLLLFMTQTRYLKLINWCGTIKRIYEKNEKFDWNLLARVLYIGNICTVHCTTIIYTYIFNVCSMPNSLKHVSKHTYIHSQILTNTHTHTPINRHLLIGNWFGSHFESCTRTIQIF